MLVFVLHFGKSADCHLVIYLGFQAKKLNIDKGGQVVQYAEIINTSHHCLKIRELSLSSVQAIRQQTETAHLENVQWL